MRFNDNSLMVGYIKEFLHSFNLPTVKVYTENTVLYEGNIYIKDNYVCKYSNGEFKRLYPFSYNKPMLNLTKNLIIKSSIYDSYTHNYLGEYLRFLRDYKKINLMGMYNCFSNEQLERVEYSYVFNKKSKDIFDKNLKTMSEKVVFSIKTDLTDYIYYAVPVKFNQNYTIALNCDNKFELACILYNDTFISSTPDELIEESYQCSNGLNFTSPMIINTSYECAKDLYHKEKDLKLILKLPRETRTSIVVLEGNFLPCANILDGGFISDIVEDESHLPEIYYSKNSLLYVDDKELHPYADRLNEYLLRNVITNTDFISKNIKMTQDYIYKGKKFKGVYGIWDDNIQYEIYNLALKPDKTKGMARYFNKIETTENISAAKIGADVAKYLLYAPNNSDFYEDSEGQIIIVKDNYEIKSGASYTLTKTELNSDSLVDYLYIYYYKKIPIYDSEGHEIDYYLEPFYLDFKEKINYEVFSGDSDISYTITNNTASDMINLGNIPAGGPDEDNAIELDSGNIETKKSPKEQKVKNFLDMYFDIYGYVDKDVESMLRLL